MDDACQCRFWKHQLAIFYMFNEFLHIAGTQKNT